MSVLKFTGSARQDPEAAMVRVRERQDLDASFNGKASVCPKMGVFRSKQEAFHETLNTSEFWGFRERNISWKFLTVNSLQASTAMDT